MANAVYPTALAGFLGGLIDLDTAVIKASYVRGYTYSASHTFMSDVTGAGGTVNGTSAALTSVTLTAGVFDADDTTITTTSNGSNHVLILFQASAVTGGADVASSAQRVVLYVDTGTGIPLVPGTGVNNVTFDAGTNRIFKIG